MISDTERRAVAHNIRENYVCDGLGYKAATAYNIAMAIGMNPGVLVGDIELWNRLADLIEPEPERTYHPERIGTAYHSALMCSACKYSLDEVTVYCPHCGARLEGVSHGKR